MNYVKMFTKYHTSLTGLMWDDDEQVYELLYVDDGIIQTIAYTDNPDGDWDIYVDDITPDHVRSLYHAHRLSGSLGLTRYWADSDNSMLRHEYVARNRHRGLPGTPQFQQTVLQSLQNTLEIETATSDHHRIDTDTLPGWHK